MILKIFLPKNCQKIVFLFTYILLAFAKTRSFGCFLKKNAIFFRRKLLEIMIVTLTPGESLVPGSAFDFMPRLKEKKIV
jgi:hypothetical protein